MDKPLATALGRQNRRLYLLVAVLILVSLPVFVLLIGSTFEIEVSPEDAESGLQMKLVSGIAIPYFDRYLVVSSAARYALQSPGYVDKVITLNRGSVKSKVKAELSPLEGIIAVEVDTENEVFWQVLGSSDRYFGGGQVIQLPQGPATFVVEGPEVETLQREVYVEGKGVRQTVELRPKEVDAQLDLTIEPANASVRLNGAEQPTSSGYVIMSLEVGNNVINLDAPGYESFQKNISVTKSGRLSLGEITLIPLNVKLALASLPSRAAVFLDSVFKGETPLDLSVSPQKSYAITLRKVGYEPIATEVTPQIGQNIVQTFDFSGKSHGLKVTTSVPAELQLNGQRLGGSPLTVTVREGDLVEVTAKGYASESFVVTPTHMKIQEKYVQLVTMDRKAFVDARPTSQVEDVTFVRLAGVQSFQPDLETVQSLSFKVPDLYVSDSEISITAFSRFSGERVPVGEETLPKINVGWEEAVAYCNWLSAQEGLEPFYVVKTVAGVSALVADHEATGYRLPTLVEWKYFLAGGDIGFNGYDVKTGPTSLPRGIGNISGRERAGQAAWYFAEYIDDFTGRSPGRSFRSNKLGLYDLVGNVKEWLHNRSGRSDSYYGSDTGVQHLVAGSSYQSGESSDLSHNHLSSELFGGEDIGFRVVREIR
jgi:formylglycine-generating enzyme required for sulfatase activity